MKTYNEFKSKSFDWLKNSSGIPTTLRYVMAWEPEFDCNTEIARWYYELDKDIFSQYVRTQTPYKIT